MLPGVHGSGYLHRLIVDKALAAIDKVFPLRASALHDFLAALYIFPSLAFAALDQLARLIDGLARADTYILRAIFGGCDDVFAGLPAALGRVENSNECAESQTCQEPSECLLIVRCHKENSFHKPEVKLRVSNPVGRECLFRKGSVSVA